MLVKSESQLWLRNIVAAGCIALLLAVGFTSAQATCPQCLEVELQAGSLLPLLPQEAVPMTLPLGNALPASLVPKDSATAPAVQASPSALPAGAKPLPHSSPVVLRVGEVKELSFDFKIPEISVRDPAILTAVPLAPDRIEFTAVAAGTTEVQVTSEERRVQILRFRVIPDVRDLKSKVEKEFPDADVNITGTTDGFVNLFGQVTTEQITKINEFVVANCNLPVRNKLSDTDPIAIKIKVYEVSNTKLKELGIDWSKLGLEAPKSIESLRSLLLGVDRSKTGGPLAFGKLEKENRFDDFFQTLERHDIAKLLDQPVLVAHHGRVAEFFSGGEFPMAVINEKGLPTVEFRSYGTKIQTTPHIHSKEEMTLEIRAEVSEIDSALTAKTGVPGFRVRRVNTGMRVKPGETIALIGDYRNENGGDAESTELVFLISPRLIEKKPESELTREAALKSATSQSPETK